MALTCVARLTPSSVHAASPACRQWESDGWRQDGQWDAWSRPYGKSGRKCDGRGYGKSKGEFNGDFKRCGKGYGRSPAVSVGDAIGIIRQSLEERATLDRLAGALGMSDGAGEQFAFPPCPPVSSLIPGGAGGIGAGRRPRNTSATRTCRRPIASTSNKR